MGAGTVLLVAVGVVYVIARQVLPRRVSWLTLMGIPVALAYLAVQHLPAGPVPARQLAELAAEVALATGAGIWQARVTQVFERDGRWYLRGGPVYLGVWVLLLAARIALQLGMGGRLGLGSKGAGDLWMVWVELAVAWGARTLALFVMHPELRGALGSARQVGS